MDEYECLDQYFNFNEDEFMYSDFSAQTNGVVSTTVQNNNLQCNPLQNDHQALPQQLNNNGFVGGFDQYIHCDSYPVNQGKKRSEVLNYPLPDFAASNELHSQSQASSVSSDKCNGTGKPRTRARRGQATDPHSIAERLRREKISDRMKNLQELLPNPNKTDKSSMLDEIIEYVKFLQLQIKVLSMSRHGSTDAVVPLTRDYSQAEGVDDNELLVSRLVAFERELTRLMDQSNATQFLQSKGLCLVPLSLVSAISSSHRRSEIDNNVTK